MLVYDNCEKATIMNIFLAKKLAYNFPPSQVDTSFTNRISPEISEIPFDKYDTVSNKLARLKTRKVHGCDVITPEELKLVAHAGDQL